MKNSTMLSFSFLSTAIIFKYMDNKHTFSKHIHKEDFMIGTPIKGISLFTIEDKKYEVNVGEICIIPPNIVHACTPLNTSKEWKFLTFHPSIKLLQNIVNSICLEEVDYTFKNYIFKDIELSNYLQKIITNTLTNEKIQEDDTLNFLNILFSNYAIFNQKKELKAERFELLFSYLRNEDYCLRNLNFHKMAEIMKMNPYYFHRVFSKTIGLTPQTYINALRLSKATKLLKDYDSLANVAQECGFYDQAYFTKQFKKYYGITPTNYKEI